MLVAGGVAGSFSGKANAAPAASGSTPASRCGSTRPRDLRRDDRGRRRRGSTSSSAPAEIVDTPRQAVGRSSPARRRSGSATSSRSPAADHTAQRRLYGTVSVFIGQGPARLDDGTINPNAKGLLLDGAIVRVPDRRRQVRDLRHRHGAAARDPRRQHRRHGHGALQQRRAARSRCPTSTRPSPVGTLDHRHARPDAAGRRARRRRPQLQDSSRPARSGSAFTTGGS